MLRGTEIKPGQPLPVAAGERCELGDGLSGTAFLVDWQGDGGRDILYSLLPNMHGGGVYLYRERRADRAEVPWYDPPEPLAEVTGYHALPLVTHEGQLHLLTFGNPTRVPERESDPGWLKLYRNRGPRTAPRFAGPAERVSVDGKALAEVFAAADLWNLNPYRDGSGVTHLVISCLYEYVVEYWPDVRGTDLRDYPDMGAGRGYRSDGTWMGRRPATRVFLLRNAGSDDQPEYGPPELLAEYRSWDGRTDAALVDVDRDGALELLVRRDVDRLYAMRLTAVEASSEERAGTVPGAAPGSEGELPRLRATGDAWELPCSPLRRGCACGEIHSAGIVRRHDQPSAVRAARKHLAEPNVLPPTPAVAAAEHGDLRDDVDHPGGRGADLNAVQVHRVVADVQSVRDRVPAFAPVPAGEQAAHLDCAVYVRRVRRIGGDSDYALGERLHVRRDVGVADALRVHLPPGLPAVQSAVDRARLVTGEYHVRVGGVKRKRPDVLPVARRLQRFPVLAPVAAAVHALLSAGVQDGRPVRMHEQRPDLWLRWQTLFGGLPLSSQGHAIQPALCDVVALARKPDVYVGGVAVRGHILALRFRDV